MHTVDATKTVLTMSPQNKHVLTVDSDDVIRVETLDCFSNMIQSETQLFSSVGWDQVNPATGPIAVRGASPGDTLRIDILTIDVSDEGTMTTHPDFGVLPGSVEERTRKIPIIDGNVQFDENYAFPIDPMIGVIGTAPKTQDIPTG